MLPCFVNFSDHERDLGFSLVLDMRGNTWHGAKPMLKALQVCTVCVCMLLVASDNEFNLFYFNVHDWYMYIESWYCLND